MSERGKIEQACGCHLGAFCEHAYRLDGRPQQAERGAPPGQRSFAMPSNITPEMLEHWFTYQPPRGDAEVVAYTEIRHAALRFAKTVLTYTPGSPDQTVALRTIREAVMWANAAVALEGR